MDLSDFYESRRIESNYYQAVNVEYGMIYNSTEDKK